MKLILLTICCIVVKVTTSQTVILSYDAFGNRLTKSLIGTNPNPMITGSPTSVCRGQNIQLTAAGGSNYVWSDGRTGTTISVIADSTRTYSVTAFNTNGCSAIAYYKIVVNTCSLYNRAASNEQNQSLTIADEKEDADWNLYPNPASNGTTVNLVKRELDKVVISVFDALGRKLAGKTITGKTSCNVPLEKSLFPTSGIYLIQVAYNEKTTIKKLWVTY